MEESPRVPTLLRLAVDVLQAHTVACFTGDEHQLVMHAAFSFSRNLVRGCQVAPGDGLVGWVMREQQPVVVHNFQRDTRTLGFYREDEKIKSFAAVPLPHGLGVLAVDSKRNYRFTDERLKILRGFATVIGEVLAMETNMVALERRLTLERMLLACQTALWSHGEEGWPAVFQSVGTKIALRWGGVAGGKGALVWWADSGRLQEISPVDGLVGRTLAAGAKIFIAHQSHRPLPVITGLGTADNFLGLPMTGPQWSCLFVVKTGDPWHPAEIQALERLAGILPTAAGTR